jgi:hypothetical protein
LSCRTSAVTIIVVACATGSLAQDAVWTGHYDSARTGANTRERSLNPGNVNAESFGRLGKLQVQGCVAAQPLYVPKVATRDKGVRNVVYVATTSNDLYAFDADSLERIYQRNVGLPVPSGAMNSDVGYYDFPNCGGPDDFGPVGIVGTPVIDVSANALYVVANIIDPPKTDGTDGLRTQHHFIFKIDIRSGEDMLAPVEIAGTYAGTQFDPHFQLQRSALLLRSGKIYVAFASHDDARPYSGWMFAYDTNLQKLRSVNYSPKQSGAGIWQSGAGPAAGLTNIFVTTGNNAEFLVGADDNADSILQIDPDTLEVKAKTSFPEEANDWDYSADIDLGSSRVIPIFSTPYAIAGSKLGDIFVMDRSNMRLVNRFQAANRQSKEFDWTGIYNGLAVWNDTIFVWPGGGGANEDPEVPFHTDVLKSYKLQADGSVQLRASGQNDGVGVGYQGASVVLSGSRGDMRNAIVWATTPEANGRWLRTGHLRAYSAASIGVFTKLWSDSDIDDPEGAHAWAKFSQPLIANGRVYLPTYSGHVMVYGLYPSLTEDSSRAEPGDSK